MTEVETSRAILLQRLEDLDVRIHQIDDELQAHNSKDWEELALEREEDEVLEGVGLASQAEIQMIIAALKRVDEGEYGACVKCGEDIPPQRLELLPATPFCAKCAP